jgi:hypothetical protein
MSEPDRADNRRRLPRLRPRGEARIARLVGPLELSEDLPASLLDVSASGARLTFGAPLEVGQEVVILLARKNGLCPVRLAGRVVWCKAAAADKTAYRIGVQFRTRLPWGDMLDLC